MAKAGTKVSYLKDAITDLLAETMWPVFEHKGDAMPLGRTKVVH